jgi:hypothetical protein
MAAQGMSRPYRTESLHLLIPGTACRALMKRPVRTWSGMCKAQGMGHRIQPTGGVRPGGPPDEARERGLLVDAGIARAFTPFNRPFRAGTSLAPESAGSRYRLISKAPPGQKNLPLSKMRLS